MFLQLNFSPLSCPTVGQTFIYMRFSNTQTLFQLCDLKDVQRNCCLEPKRKNQWCPEKHQAMCYCELWLAEHSGLTETGISAKWPRKQTE